MFSVRSFPVKKVASLLLALVLIVISCGIAPPVFAVSADIDRIQQKSFGSPEFLTTPVETNIIFDGAVGSENGNDVLYTTNKGDPSVFHVVDLDDYSVLRSLPMSGVGETWSHNVAPNGDVYVATAGGGARLWRYSPSTQSISVAATFSGESYAWSADIDANGNVYVGTYPNGKVYKYDPSTSTVTDYGRVIGNISQEYVRSIAYNNGYVYAGTAHDQIVRVDTTNGTKTNIASSLNETGTVYDLDIVDNRYLVARYSSSKNAYVYDTQTSQWSSTVMSNVNGLHVANDSYNGKFYFMADGVLKSYDLSTDTVASTGMNYDSGLRGADWAYIDDPALPGISLVTVRYTGGVTFFNMQTSTVVTYTDIVPPQPAVSGKVALGPGNEIYVAAMQSSRGGIYDPATDTRTYIELGQAGSMQRLNGKMYMGVYPGAKLYEFDPSISPGSGTNPALIDTMDGDGQSRVPAMIEGGGKLYLGTVSDYGVLGGALAVYDPATSNLDVFRNVVSDQSVISLAYFDDYVYGSTSIHNGLGTSPTASSAKIFKWDPVTETKVSETSINLPGIGNPEFIDGLAVGPDGLIWGGSENVLFAIDPETLDVVKSKKMFPDGLLYYGLWGGIDLHWSDDDFLYASMDKRLIAVDPYTMHSVHLADAESFAVGDDNHIYYLPSDDRTKLYRIKSLNQVPYNPDTEPLPLVNTSFEEPLSGSTIPGWSEVYSPGSGTSYSISNVQSKDGDYSLKLVDTSSSSAVALQSDEVDVVAGEYYHAQASIYRVSGQASVLLRFYDSSGTDIGSAYRHLKSNTGQWHTVDLHTIAPAEAKTARIVAYVTSYGQTEAYYDDISLVSAPKASLTVDNPGFETTDGSGNPEGWTSQFATNGNAYYEVSTTRSTSGNSSLKISDTTSSTSVALKSDPIPVERWAEYTAQANMWIDSGTASFMLRYYDSSDNQVASQGLHLDDNYGQWQTAEISLNAPSNAETARIWVYTTSYQQATAYYDDITFSTRPDIAVSFDNPGFEASSSTTPNWTVLSSPNANTDYEVSQAISYTGDNSLKITDQSTSAAVTLISDSVSAVSGMSYTASTKLYLLEGQASLYVRYYDSSGNELDSIAKHVNDKPLQWQNVEITATAPANTSYMKVLATTTTGATTEAYYDDFIVYWNVE